MVNKVVINKLRHLARLEFEIPGQGVWLLTGANGTGKTSLLGCLRRIGDSNAFLKHFRSSAKSTQLDSYDGASVEYWKDARQVTYTYGGTRWTPTPKANSRLLREIGYPAVLYIAANADRVEPTKDDFSPRRVRPAPQNLIDAANRILNTSKFDALKIINTRKGVGSQAFLLELPGQLKKQKHYFSERNLSLGELCILKLLRELENCSRGALVLIDELELALHPSAQSELHGYLEKISLEKALTVIVSTHSATLIKHAKRSSVLYLQSCDAGLIQCLKGCFPSFVLGALAYREEAGSDLVLYVEDEAARVIVEQLCAAFLVEHFANELVPSISVIAVGGFPNVLRFFVRQRTILPAITACKVVLDQDAEASLEAAEVPEIRSIYRHNKDSISFLPFTPEVGLLRYLNQDRAAVVQALRQKYALHNIGLRAIDVDRVPDDGTPKQRDICKKAVGAICEILAAQIPNASEEIVFLDLCKLLAVHTYASDPAVKQILGPILRNP